ncbi:MAG: response regulator [Deltaproteobacteria bacterium]
MKINKILIIDDDDSFRRVLEYHLQAEGHDVLCASSGEVGLALAREENPDLIITDVKMPDISGLDVLDAVRKSAPTLRVIVMTAFGIVDNNEAAMQLGASDCIAKPFNCESLKQSVRKVLN